MESWLVGSSAKNWISLKDNKWKKQQVFWGRREGSTFSCLLPYNPPLIFCSFFCATPWATTCN